MSASSSSANHDEPRLRRPVLPQSVMAAVHSGNTARVLSWIDASPKNHGNAKSFQHRVQAVCVMSHAKGIINDVTVLMLVCATGNTELISALIERGSTLDSQDSDGNTALIGVARNGSAEAVRLLCVSQSRSRPHPLTDAAFVRSPASRSPLSLSYPNSCSPKDTSPDRYPVP